MHNHSSNPAFPVSLSNDSISPRNHLPRWALSCLMVVFFRTNVGHIPWLHDADVPCPSGCMQSMGFSTPPTQTQPICCPLRTTYPRFKETLALSMPVKEMNSCAPGMNVGVIVSVLQIGQWTMAQSDTEWPGQGEWGGRICEWVCTPNRCLVCS